MEESGKQAYKKALLCVANAAKRAGRVNFLNCVLAAGAIAYEDSRKSKELPAEIARQAVAKLPKAMQDGLAAKDKTATLDAIANTLLVFSAPARRGP